MRYSFSYFYGRRWVLAAALIVLAMATAAIAVERSGFHGEQKLASTRSVVFYYQHIDSPAQAATFRGAGIVVTSGQRSDATAIGIIHSVGAQAFKYVNAYWYPADRVYQGIDIGHHLSWAFCARGRTPLLGRRLGQERWYYLDANERAARSAFLGYLKSLKKDGYDGVFFDRGSPSLRASAGIAIAWRRSTCTDDPVNPARPRFADVFAGLLHEVKARLQLRVLLNYGHPFNGVRLRPDPNDPLCRIRPRTNCRYLSDVSSLVDGVVDENQNDDRTTAGFLMEYTEDLAAERHGKVVPVIRGIKVDSPNRRLAFYRWARVRLFNVATFINTGDDRCPNATRACFRYGTYPELTRIDLGQPLGRKPSAWQCPGGHLPACVWVRRYFEGMTLVNASAVSVRVRVPLGTSACRYVKDVFRSRRHPVMVERHCMTALVYDMPPWSGRVFVYHDTPWS